MPTYSELTIRFTNDWVGADFVRIVTYLDDTIYKKLGWTWVTTRSTNYEVTTGTATGNLGERAAINFKTAFDLDQPTGYVTSIQNTNEVLIQSETLGEIFVSVFPYPNNTGTLEIVVNNDNTDPDSNESNLTALVERYYISYCDDFNTDRLVYILQRGFIGAPIELTADVNPISISYESSEDFKFSPIRPSTAEVFLIFDTESGTQFEEFWTADEKEFQVQDIKDNVIEWIGYVIPNGFSYEFIGGKYHASIEASDGLGTLESIPFVDDNQKPYGNQDLVYNDEFEFPPILILTEVLKKLELDLDLWTCVDSYEKSMTKIGDVRAADPLSNCYFNVKTYIKEGENKKIPYWYGSGEEWNCKEVLENLLYIFGAKLYQEYGVWRVKSINADVDYGGVNLSTNFLPFSDNLSNSNWIKNYVTISPNAIQYLSTSYYADKVIEAYSTGNQLHYIQGTHTKATTASNFTFSCYVKAAELTTIKLMILAKTGTDNARVVFDLSTQTFSLSGANGTLSYIGSGYTDEGSGWYRIWITATSTAEDTIRTWILLRNGGESYAGDGTSGIYVRGMQLVSGDLPLDYVDTNSSESQRYWRKYNTVATYLGNYEVVDDQVNIPCNDTTKFLIGNSHVMSMDTPYKSFRYNYEYTFVRDGDTPINVIPNSSFCDFNNTSILAAPTDWQRWVWEDKWYIRIKDITVPFTSAGGNTCGIEIGTHKAGIPTQQGQIRTDNNPSIWTSLQSTSYPYVEKGAKLTLDVWNKYQFSATGLSQSGFNIGVARFYPVYRMYLWTDTKAYCLVNSIVDNKRKYTWEETEFKKIPDLPIGDFDYLNLYGAKWFYLDFGAAQNTTSVDETTYDWWHFLHELAPTPEAGYLEFNIHGLSSTMGEDNNERVDPPFKTNQEWGLQDDEFWLKRVKNDWTDQGGNVPRLQIAGLKIGRIPNEAEFAQQQDYVYDNTNTNYSYQTDPITIYHGDVINENHVSGINVPTNTTGIKNFWDDLSGTYGNSSLGLLTVRQIMRQYQKPYRILEGDVKIQDARFGTIYTFSVLPNVRFLLQRGTFNKQKQYIEGATFIQITDDVLADAGYEGGDSLDPDFQPTNNSWCEVVNGLNTGYVVTEEIDINPNSETYQETQETVSLAQDLTSCPLNIPRYYYWGSDDIYLNTATLSFSPLTTISSKEIQISFNNDEGNYLYFVHKKVIDGVGQVVERIYTPTSPNNVLSDWVYVADCVIDGYIYRVLRTDYTMVAFTGFTHNFVFA